MDPLTAFGIVCNVIQVVDFGLQTLSTCREIALRGSTSANLDAEYAAGHLRGLSRDLQSCLAPLSPPNPTSGNANATTATGTLGDKQLQELALRCEQCATELTDMLEKLKVGPNKGKIKAVAKTVETIWKRGQLTAVQNKLENLRRTLDTRILARLW